MGTQFGQGFDSPHLHHKGEQTAEERFLFYYLGLLPVMRTMYQIGTSINGCSSVLNSNYIIFIILGVNSLIIFEFYINRITKLSFDTYRR